MSDTMTELVRKKKAEEEERKRKEAEKAEERKAAIEADRQKREAAREEVRKKLETEQYADAEKGAAARREAIKKREEDVMSGKIPVELMDEYEKSRFRQKLKREQEERESQEIGRPQTARKEARICQRRRPNKQSHSTRGRESPERPPENTGNFALTATCAQRIRQLSSVAFKG